MTKEEVNLTDEMTAVLEEIVEETETKKEELVVQLNENEFMIQNRQYKLVTNYRDGFNAEKFDERFSEVLARYDYIVGDWGYEQLRLKGFFDKDNRKSLPDQRIDTLEDYLYEYCNFGCAYFVLQRIGGKREKGNHKRRKKRNNTGQAHIAEKKENPDRKHKPKPVIKNRQDKSKKSKTTKVSEAAETKKSFTIRKREE